MRGVCWLVSEARGYELPLGVFDSVGDVSEFLGMSLSTVHCAISRGHALRGGYMVRRIELAGEPAGSRAKRGGEGSKLPNPRRPQRVPPSPHTAELNVKKYEK